MLDRFRDLIVLASVPDAISTGLLDVPPDRAETLAGQASRSGLAALTRAAEIVSTGLDQMRGATSPRLLLELMCAQILLPAAGNDERSVLARLERLEAGAVASSHAPERTPVTPQRPPAPQPERPAEPASVPPASQRGAPATGPRSEAVLAERRGKEPGPGAPEASGDKQSERDKQSPPADLADELRQGWGGVLETIKSKRRVAWMLLNNASVVSLDEGVLTLRFPRQGDVKGFASSGYEDLLKQVLHARFGVNVMVRAISGPDTGPAERRPSGGPNPGSGSGGGVPARGDGHFGGPTGGGGYPTAQTDMSDAVSGGGLATATVAPAAPAPRPGAERAAGQARNQPGTAMAAEGSAADEEFDPDSDDIAASDLSPMELVQRELGGQIIGEFED
jgi:DNA polymerase III subunit gamma/tau